MHRLARYTPHTFFAALALSALNGVLVIVTVL